MAEMELLRGTEELVDQKSVDEHEDAIVGVLWIHGFLRASGSGWSAMSGLMATLRNARFLAERRMRLSDLVAFGKALALRRLEATREHVACRSAIGEGEETGGSIKCEKQTITKRRVRIDKSGNVKDGS